MGVNIVLFQPEIPQNTGNIARTCDCAGAALHIVHPLGFHLTERNLRRAGMDYFEEVELIQWASTEAFLEAHGADDLFLFTGRAHKSYGEIDYGAIDDIFLCFGRESSGIDPWVLDRYEERCVRIPMLNGRRSLNLANSVAIALYEAQRQRCFPGMV